MDKNDRKKRLKTLNIMIHVIAAFTSITFILALDHKIVYNFNLFAMLAVGVCEVYCAYLISLEEK
ncbi:MAG: hypothetical protein LKE61_01435 [Erysipelotrichaceae bacterium]|jgi:cytochrome c-type biogenesis protein CcmE|nr:hypothetical protein [Lactimicrobium massiliense]MCH4019525.1 hypothetical protein [Erysipelotrichaceae bacterium]MCI1327274.1 hypothetical protein [Solobacterium sp.]MCH4045479.1 hypothetical protein [Erysipelotrichaceae bacterium]MCH4122689.1 hypothetical protein [Erysipelotrichaceae bacterium]MCI1385806.1 hypothetical protein [Solobacterium sp.]